MLKLIEKLPLIAILRGIKPENSVEVAKILVESGFTTMEVTLNSENPYESIRRISDFFW